MSGRGLLLLVGLCCVASPGAAVELDCLIQPRSTVTVSSPIEGRVDSIVVRRGDEVEVGEVVATLESSVEQGTHLIATQRARATGRVRSGEIRLDYAQRELERQKSLEQRDIVSTREMDEARENRALAEALLLEAREDRRVAELERDRAKANLELRTIRSPVSGVVVKRVIEPGEYADPPQILEVAELDPLYVEVFAPLSVHGQVAVGAEAEVLPELPVGGSHKARVTVVDRVIDAASGTFGIRLELPNPGYAIPAGLNCKVRLPDPPTPVAATRGPTEPKVP